MFVYHCQTCWICVRVYERKKNKGENGNIMLYIHIEHKKKENEEKQYI